MLSLTKLHLDLFEHLYLSLVIFLLETLRSLHPSLNIADSFFNLLQIFGA